MYQNKKCMGIFFCVLEDLSARIFDGLTLENHWFTMIRNLWLAHSNKPAINDLQTLLFVKNQCQSALVCYQSVIETMHFQHHSIDRFLASKSPTILQINLHKLNVFYTVMINRRKKKKSKRHDSTDRYTELNEWIVTKKKKKISFFWIQSISFVHKRK